MTNKMTYVTALDYVLATVDNDEVKEKLTALRASIEKKNSAERKPTKAQIENERMRSEILTFIVDAHTATEVAENFGISNQRATALLTALVKAEKVERFVEKRKAYFKAVG